MTIYTFKGDGRAAHLHPDATTLTVTQEEWGGHIRSNVNHDTQGWVHVPVIIPSDVGGKKLKLEKVEVAYATGWKTIFDAIKVTMGPTEILNKHDFGFSHDLVNTVEFATPGSPHIDQKIEISLLITINSGQDVHGRWATIESVGAYLSPV